jgi:hypothetical protein
MLQKIRDVALTVMAVLVSLVCAVLLFLTVAAGSALSEIGNRISTPTPAATLDEPSHEEPLPLPTGDNGEPCIGEVPIPGC